MSTDQQAPGSPPGSDAAKERARNLNAVAGLARDLLEQWKTTATTASPLPDLPRAFAEMTARSLAELSGTPNDPLAHWAQFTKVWENVAARSIDPEVPPLVEPEPGDRRFRDPAWATNPVFDLLKQHYLATTRWMEGELQDLAGLEPQAAQQVVFYTRQFMQALAPTNFLLTNPEALRLTLESNGENLVRGLAALLADIERGGGRLRVSTSDTEAFVIGQDLATSPGKVIFRNDLMELLQYEPSTPQTYQRPLLIVPPWINKFYILDLRPENSFVRWAVAQGYTVFMVSWVNPDQQHASKTFEDYMVEGPLAALDAIERATGEREVTAIGYCLGGTLLTATLAHLAARGDSRITAAALLATQVDFSESGELAVFASESQVAALERRMAANGGYLDADTMMATFNMLRANDLIWSCIVGNYLLGRDLPAFDLLFWNADATRMPAPMESYYLRQMYLANALVEPGALELGGTPIDLSQVTIPVYALAARDDHIAPHRSVFKLTHYLGGPVRFVLAGSGHIAGIVNPPAAMKYGHLVSEQSGGFANVREWVTQATERPGSWWVDWDEWLAPQSGPMVPARTPGGGSPEPLDDAPGTYVRVRA
jgi:polyhydroxyalkanoate synthase subunit PhaC